MPTTKTPLRYPGGKTKIYPMVSELLSKNNLLDCVYAEAFCGGAGLAIKLLLDGKVSSIILNDLDPAIYSIWDMVVNHSDELIEFIEQVPLDMQTWHEQKAIYETSKTPSKELGLAAFYLNRTNRSGILDGGVIGGQQQLGKYKLDARFNRTNLIKKVQDIAKCCQNITLTNLDVIDFLSFLEKSKYENLFLYLDPPYVQKGPGLYQSSFDAKKHVELAQTVKSYNGTYMITYDTDELVDTLYKPSSTWPIYLGSIDINYSATTARKNAIERLILSPDLVA